MIKFSKVFPILALCIFSLLLVFLTDMDERSNYDEFHEMQETTFSFSKVGDLISDAQVREVLQEAESYDVLMMKELYNKDLKCTDFYVSVENLSKFYLQYFPIKKGFEENPDSYISTFETKSKSETGYHPDFLNNDRIRFFKSTAMADQDVYIRGTYSVFFSNGDRYYQFMDRAEEILGQPKEELISETSGRFKEQTKLMKIAILGSLSLFLLLFFLVIIFDLYRQAKKIGSLRLLGYKFSDISISMLLPLAVQLGISSLVILVLSGLLISNVTVKFLTSLGIFLFFVLILTGFASIMALSIVVKNTDISNNLKKESLIRKISDLCLISQCVVGSLIIFFTAAMLPFLVQANDSIERINQNTDILDYAVFPRFMVNNDSYKNQNNYLDFFKSLDEKETPFIYASFSDYTHNAGVDEQSGEIEENSGSSYRFASIDRNYLKMYDLELRNEDREPVSLGRIEQEVYLLPDSKKEYFDKFKKKIEQRYDRKGITYKPIIFFYPDQSFNTFDCLNGVPVVQSPILRVIDKNYPNTSVTDARGLDIAGTGMNTALKFKIGKDSEDYYKDKLRDKVVSSGLKDVLTEDTFVSYRSYFGSETTNFHKLVAIFLIGTFIGISAYFILTFQTFILFLEARANQVAVKIVLGFKRIDIFKSIISWNILATSIPVLLVVGYFTLVDSVSIMMVLAMSSVFYIVDLVILLTITHLIGFENVYKVLKEG